MKMNLAPIFSLLFMAACDKQASPYVFQPPSPPPVSTDSRPGSLGIVGDTADVQTATQGGLVIMGGSTDVDAAFQWMLQRSGGGDVVIIRATGTAAYNSYVKALGHCNSVETLKIDSRSLAEDPGVARIIRNAEMLFIAGGDQSDYTKNWKNTKVMDAINYLLTEKKVPVGGTSAGAAVLGNYYFSGEKGTVTSDAALSNPYHQDITLYKDDFLKAPFMENVITDQHFSQRERQGRTMVFLGRIITDWSKVPYAIAVDEKTAVCIDDAGMGTVVGQNQAFFLKTSVDKKPETFVSGQPITWNSDSKAVFAVAVSGQQSGNQFNVKTFKPANSIGVKEMWWSVIGGKIFFIDN